MKPPKLYYFDRSEFIRDEDWFTKMSPRLLVLLDTFRHLTGKCIISPHSKAIGRRDDTDSQHNIERWGEVRAIDVFPYMRSEIPKNNGLWWIEEARNLNFGGFGLYLDWKYKGESRLGVHLDCRDVQEMVTWSRIDNEYHNIEKGLEKL